MNRNGFKKVSNGVDLVAFGINGLVDVAWNTTCTVEGIARGDDASKMLISCLPICLWDLMEVLKDELVDWIRFGGYLLNGWLVWQYVRVRWLLGIPHVWMEGLCVLLTIQTTRIVLTAIVQKAGQELNADVCIENCVLYCIMTCLNKHLHEYRE